jgi:hypothetical protein
MFHPQLTSAATSADLRGFVVFLFTGRLAHERVSLCARNASEDRPPALDAPRATLDEHRR